MSRRLNLLMCIVVTLPLLTACAALPPDYSPNYVYVPVASPARPDRARYVLTPEACLVPDPTDMQLLGPTLPPGCANASNLLAMVERKRDVVHGRKLGPAPAAPSARAAQKYIYGERGYLGAGVATPTAVVAPAATSTESVPTPTNR